MQSLGLIFALACDFSWAFWGLLGKLSATHGVTTTTLAFLSACASFLVTVGSSACQPFTADPTTADLLRALASSVRGLVGMLFFAMALKRVDAATIVTLSAIYPVFTVLLSPLLLQEKLSPTHIIGVLLVTLGVMLVAR